MVASLDGSRPCKNYEVTFEYIPGKENSGADALSRNINSAVCSIEELIALEDTLVRGTKKGQE